MEMRAKIMKIFILRLIVWTETNLLPKFTSSFIWLDKIKHKIGTLKKKSTKYIFWDWIRGGLT